MRVTSGFVLVTGPFTTGQISIAGTSGFSIDGSVIPGEGRVDPFHLECFVVCLPGSTISLGSAFFGSAVTGVATLDGNTYALTGSVNDPAGAGLEFVGTTQVPALTASSIVVSAPFRLFDSVFFTPSGSAILRGSGIVSLGLSPAQPSPGVPAGWAVDMVRYDFTESDPVPEPATLTLVSASLAAAALRGRLRRRKHA